MMAIGGRPANPSVSVIIAAYNQERVLPELLEGLAAQTWKGRLEVVVADNNSTDMTVDKARGFAHAIPGLEVFTAARGQGQCVARNDGLERATGDLLLFIDGDDVPANDWVAEMVGAAQYGDLVGGRLDVTRLNRPSTVARWPGSTAECLSALASFDLPYATGTNFAIWRDVLDDVGCWNETYRGGGEDADLCWRAQLKGYSLVAAEQAVVYYRLRHALRDLLPQNYRYGLAVARLTRNFARADGSNAKRDAAGLTRKLLRAAPAAARSPDDLARLLAKGAFRYGQLRGRSASVSGRGSRRFLHRAARALAGPYHAWTIEVAMRYMPVVRLTRRFGHHDGLTEIGSGGTGIAPYLGQQIVGVDQEFGTESSSLVTKVKSSVLALPFVDASRRVVVSVDMLEHVPPQVRGQALSELVRVSGELLIVAVPSGAGAAAQDVLVDQLYRQRHGENYPFLSEHLAYGLPSRAELDVAVRQAMRQCGRTGTVSYVWNTNLRLRELLMRVWVNDSRPARAVLVLANYLHPLITRLHVGRCYRLIAVVRLDA